MIERYLVRYFLAVLSHGSFSRAAAHCYVSQPTMSVGIAKLEEIIGRPLFVRTSRRVELTQAGVRFGEHAKRIEWEFTMAERAAVGLSAQGTVRLGFLATLPSRWLAQLAPAFQLAAPHQRVEIVESTHRNLMVMLNRGRIDLYVGIVPTDSCYVSYPIFSEAYSLALPLDHDLSGRAVLKGEDVRDSPMIVRRHCEVLAQTSRYFTARGVRPFMSARTTSDEQAISLVQGGHGLTVLPNCFRDHGVVLVELAGFEETRQIGVVHLAGARSILQAPDIREIASAEVQRIHDTECT